MQPIRAAGAGHGPPSPTTAQELADLRQRVAALTGENDQLKAAATPVFVDLLRDDIAVWPSSSNAPPSPPSPLIQPQKQHAAPEAAALPPPPTTTTSNGGLVPGEVIVPHTINLRKAWTIILSIVAALGIIIFIGVYEAVGPKPRYSGNATDTDG